VWILSSVGYGLRRSRGCGRRRGCLRERKIVVKIGRFGKSKWKRERIGLRLELET
jgi:hypothetical protein